LGANMIKIAKIPPRTVRPKEVRELRDFLLNNPEIYHFRADLIHFVIKSALNNLKTSNVK